MGNYNDYPIKTKFKFNKQRKTKMEMILDIKNFTQKYNDKVAVDNLSLSVEKGEIFGFIGHNGAGKSTTSNPL